MSPIRILLTDDSPEFLESAAHFLSLDPRIEVIGQASSGGDALRQLAWLKPDVVLMDLVMPDMDGLEATRQIKKRPDAPLVIMLTIENNPEYRATALAVGADGFVTKSEFGMQLLPLVCTVFPELDAPTVVKPPVTNSTSTTGDSTWSIG